MAMEGEREKIYIYITIGSGAGFLFIIHAPWGIHGWFHQPLLEEALLGPGQTIGQEDCNCPQRFRLWTAFGFIRYSLQH